MFLVFSLKQNLDINDFSHIRKCSFQKEKIKNVFFKFKIINRVFFKLSLINMSSIDILSFYRIGEYIEPTFKFGYGQNLRQHLRYKNHFP